MRTQTPLSHPLGPLLLLISTFPAPLNATTTTTTTLTMTLTLESNTPKSVKIPKPTLTPSDPCTTICPPSIPGLSPLTLNTTLPSPPPPANPTSTFDPSALQGDIPRNTSTTCAHSMSHFVPPSASESESPSTTTPPSQPPANATSTSARSNVQASAPNTASTTRAHSMTPFVWLSRTPSMTTLPTPSPSTAEDLNGKMSILPSCETMSGDAQGKLSIQTVSSPSSATPSVAGESVEEEGSARQTVIGNGIAWSYMDATGEWGAKERGKVGRTEHERWWRRVARWLV